MTVNGSSSTSRPHVVIVGGGVIGISTAIGLLGHPVAPYDVTLVAPELPSLDHTTYRPPTSNGFAPASYASAWAGAHHVSDAKTPLQRRRDRVTFDVLCRLERAWSAQPWAQPSSRPIVYVYQKELWSHKAELHESTVDWYPAYKRMENSTLPDGIDIGATFKTVDLDIPKYLPTLYAYFLRLGGRAIKQRCTSLAHAVTLASSEPVLHLHDGVLQVDVQSSQRAVSAVIASPGLGAKELLGDKSVMPTRGQTVLVRAPWCTTEAVHGVEVARASATIWCGVSKVIAAQGGYRDTYVIPRGDGTIICGGTRLDDDWDDQPRSETTKDILRRVLALMPQLRRPNSSTTTNGSNGTSHNNDEDDADNFYNVDVVDVNVGLRPGRRGGIRLERASAQDAASFGLEADVPLIYNYGFGGIGYQSSWGAAFEARALVDEALQRKPAPEDATFAELDNDSVSIPDPTALAIGSKSNGLQHA